MQRRPVQLVLRTPTWGGRRTGAGRKPSPGRRRVPHQSRPMHRASHPAHVTLRAFGDLSSLRGARVFPATRNAIAKASCRGFRVLHFTVQCDHVHLLVEADSRPQLIRGLQGLAIRLAKAINRGLGRTGRVWGDRYHVRALRTPREVRNALAYVFHNWKKHLANVAGLDPCSSAFWFEGWKRPLRPVTVRSPVVAARTWLAAVGWRRWGLIGFDERPAKPKR